MNRNTKSTKIIVLTAAVIFGIAALALADCGRGYGYGHMMGPGMHHMGGYGYGQGGYYGDLSEAELATLNQQRSDFLNATDSLRNKIYQKELALRSELAKEAPDAAKASKLQAEISKLQGELDQKQLAYELKAEKSAPRFHRGYRGYGPMMSYGPGGGRGCTW